MSNFRFVRANVASDGPVRRLAPREIQAQIRAGLTAEDVARVTGASLEYIRRFEGPVIAEREYVVESALNVPVHMAVETARHAGHLDILREGVDGRRGWSPAHPVLPGRDQAWWAEYVDRLHVLAEARGQGPSAP